MKIYALATTLLLAGCAATPQDCNLHAQDPSFLTKLSCATSGGYRQKVDDQERHVLQSQRDNRIAQHNLADTQAREEASRLKLADEKSRLATARSDLSLIMKKLKSGKANNVQRQHEIKELEALQRASLQANSASDVADLEAKIAAARKRVAALENANMSQ